MNERHTSGCSARSLLPRQRLTTRRTWSLHSPNVQIFHTTAHTCGQIAAGTADSTSALIAVRRHLARLASSASSYAESTRMPPGAASGRHPACCIPTQSRRLAILENLFWRQVRHAGPNREQHDRTRLRFISTFAENKIPTRRNSALLSVHPRLCGERFFVVSMPSSPASRFPHVLGTDLLPPMPSPESVRAATRTGSPCPANQESTAKCGAVSGFGL